MRAPLPLNRSQNATGSQDTPDTAMPSEEPRRLVTAEFNGLMLQSATSNRGRGGRRKLPRVFTEHGAIMLATVLNSPIAVRASLQVVRAFVRLRELLASNATLVHKLDELERRLEGHDAAIHNLFEAIRQLLNSPELPQREIGFHVKDGRGRYLTASGVHSVLSRG